MEIALPGIAILLVLALAGLPLGFAPMSVGFLGFAYVRGFPASMEMVGQIILDTATNYGFTVVPLFVLMGNFIFRAELSRDMYEACNAWLGHRRGGLAMATVAACGGFSAICGSSIATAATMAKVAMPEMRRHGYADTLATGSIAAGGTIGILIPPSVILVIYGILVDEDIGKLFIAGIVPGVLSILSYIVLIDGLVRLRPALGPRGDRVPWRRRVSELSRVWAVLVLFVLVLGGIYFGVFTPTEAGGIGAVGALAFALGRRKLTWLGFLLALYDSGRTTAMIFIIAFGALIMANFIEISGMPRELVDWVSGLDVPPMGVVLCIVGIYLVLGCFIESLGMVFLTVPIFAPLVDGLGFDMVWFGIVVVIVTEIAMVTPPIGINAFVLKGVIRDVSLVTIFRGIAPFWIADLARLLLILYIPAIALALPSMMD